MPLDYVTLGTALVMAYQSIAPEWTDSYRRGAVISILVVLSLSSMWLITRLNFVGLRLGWLISGVLLCGFAGRQLVARESSPMPIGLIVVDAWTGWSALALTGVSRVAVVTGGILGAILPIAVGAWPQRITQAMRPIGVVLTGAVGVRFLLKALAAGGPAWPLGLLTVPWLMLWDVASSSATKAPTRR